MLILLPPSEGKTAPRRGRPVHLATLSRPDLTSARERTVAALMAISKLPDAVARLRVGASLSEEVAGNTRLLQAPAAPAAKVYTGVLFDAAGLDTLTGTARRRANTDVRIISALWGALSPADRIPAYRLSMGISLPPLGSLGSYWADAIGENLIDRNPGVVIDCRSSAYVPAWRPPSDVAWVSVRVVQDAGGKRTVVSHNAKHTRGLLTRHLLTRTGPPPRTVKAVVTAAQEMIPDPWLEATLRPSRSGPDVLELVVPS